MIDGATEAVQGSSFRQCFANWGPPVAAYRGARADDGSHLAQLKSRAHPSLDQVGMARERALDARSNQYAGRKAFSVIFILVVSSAVDADER